MMFENRELADNLKKSNAFIQGFRPGRQTAEYLDMVQERLTLVGAIYVAFVCIMPTLMNLGSASGQALFLFGGTECTRLIWSVLWWNFIIDRCCCCDGFCVTGSVSYNVQTV